MLSQRWQDIKIYAWFTEFSETSKGHGWDVFLTYFCVPLHYLHYLAILLCFGWIRVRVNTNLLWRNTKVDLKKKKHHDLHINQMRFLLFSPPMFTEAFSLRLTLDNLPNNEHERPLQSYLNWNVHPELRLQHWNTMLNAKSVKNINAANIEFTVYLSWELL